MRAVVCPRAPIPPSELVYTTDHPEPEPKEGHVLIRVKAYGLNRSELFTRQGHSPGIQFPRVLGIECVGIVKDAGGGSKWKEGDVVAACMGGMGRQSDGGYAEYTLVPHVSVSAPIKLPDQMGWADFAAIPETYLTAWGTLSESLKLQSTDTLLIRGGTTSVGLACAALAKSSLFASDTAKPTVIATTRSAAKKPALTAVGVDVVLIDENNAVAEQVKAATAGRGAHKCVELVGGPTLTDSCVGLTDDGVCSMIGCVSGEWTIKDFDPMTALSPWKHLTLCSSHHLDISKAPLQWIVDAIALGELEPTVDKVFKMEETAKAHEYMEANSAAGKVVCIVD
ncbi:zinc-binding oxidoreductase [Fomitopsis schrenkii]|uniref:Zinc-binding oxidoreductase n=1 Tax=Fomitopsis schrenkii TaxID=2126942 RepID=S8EZJ6_FOMSC|nr:zinc-binding oxidoreductase [Fomitopsis schrenkii]